MKKKLKKKKLVPAYLDGGTTLAYQMGDPEISENIKNEELKKKTEETLRGRDSKGFLDNVGGVLQNTGAGIIDASLSAAGMKDTADKLYSKNAAVRDHKELWQKSADITAGLAPGLATIAGGPMAGAGVKALQEVGGSATRPEQEDDETDEEYALRLAEMGIDAEERGDATVQGVTAASMGLAGAYNSAKSRIGKDSKEPDAKSDLVYEEDGDISPLSQFKAEGGLIEGAGTGKSDSINAKIKPGSFIVPEENAGVAEAISNKYFGGNVAKANTSQKGGAPAKLSDGEFLFTPEQKMFLKEKGVDLDAMAPNAKKGKPGAYAKGGEVDVDKIISEAKAENEKILKKLEAQKNSEKDAKKKDALSKQIQGHQAEMNHYEKMIKLNQNYLKRANATDEQKLKNTKDIQTYATYYANSQKKLNALTGEKPTTGAKSKTDEIFSGVLTAQQEADIKNDPLNQPAESTAPLVTKPNAKGTTGAGGTGETGGKGGSAASTKATGAKYEPLNEFGTPLDMNWTPPEKGGLAQKIEETPIMGGIGKYDDKTPTPKEKDKKFTPTTEDVFAAGQMGLGAYWLTKDGKLPVGEIDQAYVHRKDIAVADAQQARDDSAFGFDPYTESALLKNIEQNRRSTVDASADLFNRDASRAMSNIRAGNEVANRSIIDTASADANLMYQKKNIAADRSAYATGLVGNITNMKRQLLEDKLNAFNQNQQTGSELLGAGIQNYFTNSRDRRFAESLKEIDELGKVKWETIAANHKQTGTK